MSFTFYDVIHKMDASILAEDFMIALVGFYFIRYIIPNSILKKNTDLFSGFILSLCYATFGIVRNFINLSRASHDVNYYNVK